MNFDGIFTPIVTPYKEDFKIDFNNLEKILNHLIDSKVHGIIIGGTTGEYYAQSLSERVEILKFAKKKK
jgi:4-hydroxy-tetrahydrodipicolinate synthase